MFSLGSDTRFQVFVTNGQLVLARVFLQHIHLVGARGDKLICADSTKPLALFGPRSAEIGSGHFDVHPDVRFHAEIPLAIYPSPTLERNHNEQFKAHMDRLLPDWRERKVLLNSTPLAYSTWLY